MLRPKALTPMSDTPGPVYAQSGVIPFTIRESGLAILLITNWRRRRWVIPKGLIEGQLSARQSAVQEAYEEAGIRGRTSKQAIGEYRYHKWGGTCHVKVFLFLVQEVLSSWPEATFRHRAWFSPESAAGMVKEKALGELIRRVPALYKEIPAE
jgi:8-oxo-dGTP pyrophosphatase MutT (NUDIX family)